MATVAITVVGIAVYLLMLRLISEGLWWRR